MVGSLFYQWRKTLVGQDSTQHPIALDNHLELLWRQHHMGHLQGIKAVHVDLLIGRDNTQIIPEEGQDDKLGITV